MGTRARVNVYEGNEILISIYRQYDGYPIGLGKEVANFLTGKAVVNGFQHDGPPAFNGMGCLAAALIGQLKDGIGNVYIRDTGPESHGEEYVYNIKEADGGIRFEVLSGCMTFFGDRGDSESEMESLFSGKIEDFNPAM